jgi:hypothetical protein
MDSLWEELFGEPDPLGLQLGYPDSPQLPFAHDNLDIEPCTIDVSPPTQSVSACESSLAISGNTAQSEISSVLIDNAVTNDSAGSRDPVAVWGPGILILENALRQHPELYTSLAASIAQHREEARMKEEDALVERASALVITPKPTSSHATRVFIPQERMYTDPMGKFYRAPLAQVTCDWTGANGRCGEVFDLAIFADITTYMRAIDLHMADHISDLTLEGSAAKGILPGRLVRCHWPDCQWTPRKPGGLARHIRTSHTLTDMVRCQRCHHPFVVNQKCNIDRHEPKHCKTDDKSISSNLRTIPRGIKYRKPS